jgi:hypothetical protein
VSNDNLGANYLATESKPNPNDEDSQVFIKYHFYILDDKSHDNYFVQHCLLLHWQIVLDNGF